MKPAHKLGRAVSEGDATQVRQLLRDHEHLRNDQPLLRTCLRLAKNRVDLVEALVEGGADINAGRSSREPEGVIYDAVNSNSIDAVRWMLEHGARVNYTVDGERRCFALTSAVVEGNLEMVRLLVKHGADYNAVWRKDSNALTYAIRYGQTDVERYLRTVGAKLPDELVAGSGDAAERDLELLNREEYTTVPNDAAVERQVDQHIQRCLGEPLPLSLQTVVPGNAAIAIRVVRLNGGGTALVTSGMSSRPMRVPPGWELYRLAELVLFLPQKFEIRPGQEPELVVGELCGRMRQLAEYPHQNGTWLSPATIIDFDEPLAHGTRMTCMLAVTEDSDMGRLPLGDGRSILFYTLSPLYSDERDLERRASMEHLLETLSRHGVGKVVDLDRISVA